MIPNELLERRKVIDYMLKAIDNPKVLTKWEEEFIDSVKDQFDSKGNLSDRQCEILEKIYEKVS